MAGLDQHDPQVLALYQEGNTSRGLTWARLMSGRRPVELDDAAVLLPQVERAPKQEVADGLRVVAPLGPPVGPPSVVGRARLGTRGIRDVQVRYAMIVLNAISSGSAAASE
jgi:hypothetical protein